MTYIFDLQLSIQCYFQSIQPSKVKQLDNSFFLHIASPRHHSIVQHQTFLRDRLPKRWPWHVESSNSRRVIFLSFRRRLPNIESRRPRRKEKPTYRVHGSIIGGENSVFTWCSVAPKLISFRGVDETVDLWRGGKTSPRGGKARFLGFSQSNPPRSAAKQYRAVSSVEHETGWNRNLLQPYVNDATGNWIF